MQIPRITVFGDEKINGKHRHIGGSPSLGDLLTLEEVAEKLGCSTSTVRQRRRDGYLHPVVAKRADSRGRPRLLFSPEEVAMEEQRIDDLFARKKNLLRLKPAQPIAHAAPAAAGKVAKLAASGFAEPAPHYTGEQAAESVRLFRAGKAQLDLVIEMKVSFELAAHLWNCWLEAQPGWFMIAKQFAQVRALIGWDEDVPTPEGFMRAFRDYTSREIERELAVAVKRQLGGEDLSLEERAALAEVDAEIADREAAKQKAADIER